MIAPGDPQQDFRPGLYMHMKSGGLYTVHELVAHHETRQLEVVYTSHRYGGRSRRPLYGYPGDEDAFLDPVTVNVDGTSVEVQRFEFVGPLPSDTPIEERGKAFLDRLREAVRKGEAFRKTG